MIYVVASSAVFPSFVGTSLSPFCVVILSKIQHSGGVQMWVCVSVGGLICKLATITIDKDVMVTGGNDLARAIAFTDRVDRADYAGSKKDIDKIREAA